MNTYQNTISDSNRRIAKNTLFLYFRTFLVMVVGLYTSRIVLAQLGFEDYGIYNVVGGIVMVFDLISGVLSTSFSRFVTFELGRGNIEQLKKIFTTSINILIIISLIVILLGETVGLWFLNNKMNIPPDRMYAANWVLQCSLISFVINLTSEPFLILIIAHERISFFAWINVSESILLRLGGIFFLYITPWDKLITYSVVFVLFFTCIRMIYGIYCKRHFEETKYVFFRDGRLMKEMFNFGGWMLLGSAAWTGSTQGTNILLNFFYGVSVNAAVGISNQVNATVKQFVSNFQTAFVPQITKLYAHGDIQQLRLLINRSSRISFLLLFAVACPLMLNVDFVLGLWLKEVPEHTSAFCILILIYSLIDAVSKPVGYVIYATGRVKYYNLLMSVALSMNIVGSYIFLKQGFPPEIVLTISIFVSVLCLAIRLFLTWQYKVLRIREFVRNVIVRSVLVSVLVLPVPLYISRHSERWTALLATTTGFVLIFATVAYNLGFTRAERTKIREFAAAKIPFLRKSFHESTRSY